MFEKLGRVSGGMSNQSDVVRWCNLAATDSVDSGAVASIAGRRKTMRERRVSAARSAAAGRTRGTEAVKMSGRAAGSAQPRSSDVAAIRGSPARQVEVRTRVPRRPAAQKCATSHSGRPDMVGCVLFVRPAHVDRLVAFEVISLHKCGLVYPASLLHETKTNPTHNGVWLSDWLSIDLGARHGQPLHQLFVTKSGAGDPTRTGDLLNYESERAGSIGCRPLLVEEKLLGPRDQLLGM
jgi:hypothetical protein